MRTFISLVTAVGIYYFFNAFNQDPDSNCCMRANRDANNMITACIAPNGTVSTSNNTYSATGVASEPFYLTRYSDGTCVKE